MAKKKTKIAVAMSGGVDSSVTALMLLEQGFEVAGFFMRLGAGFEKEEATAKRICMRLGIKFYAVNLANRFRSEIIDYFLESYKQGLTPNPCVRCNRTIKLGAFFDFVSSLGFDKLATGHYARIKKIDDYFGLFRGFDRKKDQSYFLYGLNPEKLGKIIFPLGDKKKEEVKKIAEKNDLPVIKKESQDICFLKGEDHNIFLKKYIAEKQGEIRDKTGKVLGEHQGLHLYTRGQRRGVEIGGTGPYYVVGFDYEKNILYVSDDKSDDSLFDRKINFSSANFITPKLKFPLNCQGVTRYGQKEQACMVGKTGKNKYFAEFENPQRAPSRGQSIVFYRGEEVLGGGIME